MIKRAIPNTLTLGNLACGCLAIVLVIEGKLLYVPFAIYAGAIFDFLDGFVARLLKVQSPMGKELDSLADMVTFGLAPAFIAFKLFILTSSYTNELADWSVGGSDWFMSENPPISTIPWAMLTFCIALFSALRLANFNIDTRQTSGFIGLPTPANALFWTAMPIMLLNSYVDGGYSEFVNRILQSPNFYLGTAVVFSLLLVIPMPMFALKFKHFGWKGNEVRFSFLICCLFIIVGSLLTKNPVLSLPLIVLLYLVFAIVNNSLSRKKANNN